VITSLQRRIPLLCFAWVLFLQLAIIITQAATHIPLLRKSLLTLVTISRCVAIDSRGSLSPGVAVDGKTNVIFV